MTTERASGLNRHFVRGTLPWLVAAGALLLYLITLNHWVSMSSLAHVSKLSGWSWQVELYAPLYMVLTYPLRWLPVQHIPVALNIFAAVCAALTLALLARSVALLPHDRTAAQRERERDENALLSIPYAWVPPLVAVLVCGLQISFWENATADGTSGVWSSSSRMLDLLLFAYVVRCVLEYRIDERESWLFRAAFIMGLGMTNDWAMIGFFPLFIAALIWIRGTTFFNAQFLTRMFFWGTAGLLLYFLLPLANAFSSTNPVPFWFALKTNLGLQRAILQELWGQKQVIAVLGITSLLPLLFMGIRWSSYFGDTSRAGTLLARVIFHVVHGFLLVACIWVAMDPPVSPRNQMVGQYRDATVPFMTFYYLGALAVGYLLGYFLLVFSPRRSSRFARYVPSHVRLSSQGVFVATWLIAALAPLLLLAINLPRIRMANGPFLREYAAAMTSQLPAGPAVILSDDYRRLYLIRAALERDPKAKDYIFADTGSLKVPAAHVAFHRRYPERWPTRLGADRTRPVEDLELLALLAELGKTHQVFYLHYSFGYYFEVFHPEPHGIVLKLNQYEPTALLMPKLNSEIIAANQQFWKDAREDMLPRLSSALAFSTPASEQSVFSRFMQKIHLKLAPHPDTVMLGRYYSQAMNYWGAQLQRHEMFAEAAEFFAAAEELNPDNVVAQINADYNELYRKGNKAPLAISKRIEDEFGKKYRTWEEVLRANGLYDEPGFCYSQGTQFLAGRNHRQAANQFDRAVSLYPGHLAAGMELAGMFILGNAPDQALELTGQLRRHVDPAILATNRHDLMVVEAAAHLTKKEPQKADDLFSSFLKKNPGEAKTIETAMSLFLRYRFYDEGLKWIDRQLAAKPNDANALVNKGFACIQLKQFANAIAPLSRAIDVVSTNNIDLLDSALFNRGIAHLESGQLDAAEADYRQLLSRYDRSPQVHYGLAETAYRKQDTNAALASYERYLELVPGSTQEAKYVRERIEELRGSEP